jgi:hypothetical protein
MPLGGKSSAYGSLLGTSRLSIARRQLRGRTDLNSFAISLERRPHLSWVPGDLANMIKIICDVCGVDIGNHGGFTVKVNIVSRMPSSEMMHSSHCDACSKECALDILEKFRLDCASKSFLPK